MAKPRSWAGRTRGVEDSAISTSGYLLSFVSRLRLGKWIRISGLSRSRSPPRPCADRPAAAVLVQVTSIGDIRALTSGAVEAADAARRGAAFAVYAFSGYVIAFAGPVVAGVALDWFGDGCWTGRSAGLVPCKILATVETVAHVRGYRSAAAMQITCRHYGWQLGSRIRTR
jgi:hypothetical protein